MAGLPILQVWTMRVDRLDETGAARWLPMLDDSERERAARFVFARDRVQFVAAHALLRGGLDRLCGTASAPWRLVADRLGKPAAWRDGAPAEVSFSLSHADGMVGLAAVGGGGCAIGFDLEPLARRVDLAVADHFFSMQETAWLNALAEPRRAEGFLRLWTLKEAFIKATGKGLTQDLASFSFDPGPPRIGFSAALPEREADWRFEQRLLDGGFIAAVGWRRAVGVPMAARWTMVDPADLGTAGLCDRSRRTDT